MELIFQIDGKTPSTRNLEYNNETGEVIEFAQFASRNPNNPSRPSYFDFINSTRTLRYDN